MEFVVKFFGVLAAIIIALALVILQGECNNNKIQDWAKNNRFEVVKCEECFFSTGPFWYKDEDSQIYRVVLKDEFENEKVSYFRINFFGIDQEWE